MASVRRVESKRTGSCVLSKSPVLLANCQRGVEVASVRVCLWEGRMRIPGEVAGAVLSASWMCRDAGLCSPVLLPGDRLGSCTMKSDSVSIKQFDGLRRLDGDGDGLRNRIETSALCGPSPRGSGKDTTHGG